MGTAAILDLTSGVDSDQSVGFSTSDGTLIVEDARDFHGVITQFTAGDQIVVEAPFFGGFRQSGSLISVITAGQTVGALTSPP